MKDLVKAVSARVKLPPGRRGRAGKNLALDALRGGKDHWLHKLAEHQQVAIFTGGRHAQLVEGIAESPRAVGQGPHRAQGPASGPDDATDVPTVVEEMFRQLQGQPVAPSCS